jgi:hypothetical protein
MAVQTLIVPPLDPNMLTGAARLAGAYARISPVVLDTLYGEYATGLYVALAGNVSIVKWDGTTQVLTGLAAGIVHRICSLAVNTTGTTATGILFLS